MRGGVKTTSPSAPGTPLRKDSSTGAGPSGTSPVEIGTCATSVVPDEVVTHATVAPEQVATQAEALRAHETQVIVTDGAWALSNLEAGRLSGREGFALINVDTGALVTSPLGVPDPPRKVLGDGRH